MRRRDGRPGVGRAVLRRPAIRRLVFAFGAFEAADYVLATVAAIALFERSGALAVGLVGFRFAPAAVATLFAAQLAEHHARERVLTATTLGRAATTAATAGALAAGAPVAVVIALVWVDAVVGSAYRPAQAALLPTLARSPIELTSSVTLVSNAKTSSQALGSLAGGVLVAAVPSWTAVLAATGLHLAAAGATAGVRGARAPAAAAVRGFTDRVQRLKAGVTILAADPEAARIVRFVGLRAFNRGLWLALAVVVAARLLGLGESGFGVLMAAAGVGSLLGIPLSALMPGRRHLAHWFAFGLLLCGLPLAATAVSGSAAAGVALMVPWGIGLALSDVGGMALLNRVVRAADIAPVTGTMEAAKLLSEGAGALLAPVLVAALGVRGAAICAGLILPLLVVAAWPGFHRIDVRAVGRLDLLELMRGVPWFGRLTVDALEGVVARLRRDPVAAGAVVIREGDPGSTWHLIAAGELDVEIAGYEVDRLRPGDAFGELALLRAARRAATVTARTDATLLTLSRADFLTAVSGPDAADDLALEAPAPDTPHALLAAIPLLRNCAEATLDTLAASATEHDVPAGAAIVIAGAEDDTLHVLVSGRAEVRHDGRVRRELLAGDAFGEVAVLHDVPRTATVLATEPSRVLSVPGEALRRALPAPTG